MKTRLLTTLMSSALTRRVVPKVGLASLKVRRVSPELYLAAGITSGVAAAIMLARAHKKQESVLADTKEMIETTRDYIEDAAQEGNPWTPKEEAQALAPMYGAAAMKLTRLYAPALLLGTTSVMLVLRSHGVMKGRNQALFAALQLTEAAFSKYRTRVIEAEGEDADAKYRFGAEDRTIVTENVDSEGKKTKEKSKYISLGEKPTADMYGRLFDESNVNWRESKVMNRHYLEGVQLYFNHMLNAYGFVLLNDVYEALNMPRNLDYGALVGWSLDIPGDDFVDFGLDSAANRNPTDARFMLDFNVNGMILNI